LRVTESYGATRGEAAQAKPHRLNVRLAPVRREVGAVQAGPVAARPDDAGDHGRITLAVLVAQVRVQADIGRDEAAPPPYVDPPALEVLGQGVVFLHPHGPAPDAGKPVPRYASAARRVFRRPGVLPYDFLNHLGNLMV